MTLTAMLKYPVTALRGFIVAVIWRVLKHPKLAARINAFIIKWPSLHARLVSLAGVGAMLEQGSVRTQVNKTPLSPRAERIYEQLRVAKRSERSVE
jgi:hypothetical protein